VETRNCRSLGCARDDKGEVVAKERIVTKRQDCIEEAVTEAGSVRGKENCRSLGFAPSKINP
jgi:hypothetical protein